MYLAALIIGLGTVMVQLLMGGSGDAEADADAGAEFEHDIEHDFEGEADHGDAHHGGVDHSFLPIFLSLRFWIFALLAFGLVGSALHFLDLASTGLTLIAAIALGFGSGTLASWVFRALGRAAVTSGAGEDDAVGQVGKVLIRVPTRGHGKVRIQLKGQTLDLLATTDEVELLEGEQVLVEEMQDGRARVSKAPEDFLPRD